MKPPKSVNDRTFAEVSALRRKEHSLREMGNIPAAELVKGKRAKREEKLKDLLSDEDRQGAEAFARTHKPAADFTPPIAPST